MKCKNCKTDDYVFEISETETGCEKCGLTCKKHGGKRLNAGRKSQYKEETQTISFRVPKSLIEPITKYVKRALAKSKN